jgi:hypothetical protein
MEASVQVMRYFAGSAAEARPVNEQGHPKIERNSIFE